MAPLRNSKRHQGRVLRQGGVEGGRCLHSNPGSSTPKAGALTTRLARPTKVAREKGDMSGAREAVVVKWLLNVPATG